MGFRSQDGSATVAIMQNRIRSLVFSMCLATAALLPLEADAALNAYLTVKGQKQGQIKGGVTKKGQEGRIQVISVSHEIISPRDSASGLPTGKRQHKPFVVRKPIDKSTPILNSMLTSNELIKTWELAVLMPDAKGVDTLAYTIKLTDANIASIRVITDGEGKLIEELTFTYQKIEWTWADGGITAMDDWETPVK
jgi:type VI secretion system secreted protein Hcp